MIGIGMRLAGQNVPHDHAVERVAEPLHALDAHARQIEAVAEVLQAVRHLDEFLQPFQRNQHAVSPLVTLSPAPRSPLATPRRAGTLFTKP